MVKVKAAAMLALLLLVVMPVSASHFNKNTVYNLKKIDLTTNSYFNAMQQLQKYDIYMGDCFETDNGLDYFNAGSTIYLPPVSNWCQNEVLGMLEQCRIYPIDSCLQFLPDECRPEVTPDRCRNSTVLVETYCSRDRVRERNYRCPNGCWLGECY